ncbi:TetR/AcrR family transcriptional regulator [Aeromicrobium sp.]|uniref:TetR/AcrR family transcriptional regulator n=1 Tax=Aeromicrobium sp. TaxID=1871063 RepID=UPI0019B2165C|nr:TetR/AcrR family transcriptional regulator [Aeromicrobium sp.]MBC7631944.1 TetR/AcrR family transcriptional regulator [Aeromicrobium sp.]
MTSTSTDLTGSAEGPTDEGHLPGRDAAFRRRERRDRLVLAGIQQIGTTGYDGTTVRGIASDAGLADRYFYEHFSDRMQLFVAVYDSAVARVQEAAVEAYLSAGADLGDQVQAGITTFVMALTDDPRLARIQLVESVGRGGALEARRSAVLRNYASLLEVQAREVLADQQPSDLDLMMGTRALVAATNQLIMDFTSGELVVERDDLVEHLVRLYLDITRPFLS